MSNIYKDIIKKIVERDPKKLKFDPNQPRKNYSEEAVDNIGKTYDSQGVINEPEIDENDNIITGEIRVRGAIKKGLTKIKCKVLSGLSKEDRFERQIIENLHHNVLDNEDKENAIRKLWESRKYKTYKSLADIIGMRPDWVSLLIHAKERREKLGVKSALISTRTLDSIYSLPIEEQKKIIQKIEVGQLKQGQELRELVVEIKKLPEDLKKAVLTIENPIDLKMAKIVAQFPEEEQRKDIMKSIKLSKDSLDYLLQYELEVAKGDIPKQIKLYDADREKFGLFQRISLRLMSRMNISFLEDLSQDVKYMCYNLMRQIVEHLNRELEKIEDSGYQHNNIIEVKMENKNDE